ncbi:hypothetical protein DFP90_102196 [Aestuariispira insulae]|uniref:Uncharacterized protein n=2 Tax=Aestuariispira insulae TaxID=1461337 RepID=A0A3D9HRQ6_9PROT|nr:hypothetical protein DFP90_102196 [Aestuariispira insulae]
MFLRLKENPFSADLTITIGFLVHILLAAFAWFFLLLVIMIGPGESDRYQEILEEASVQLPELEPNSFLLMTRTQSRPGFENIKGYKLPSGFNGLSFCGQNGFETVSGMPLSNHSLRLVQGCRKWVKKDFFNEISVIVTRDKAFITEYYR